MREVGDSEVAEEADDEADTVFLEGLGSRASDSLLSPTSNSSLKSHDFTDAVRTNTSENII